MNIIGIAGTNGSGKDTIGQMLADEGWVFISASTDLIIPELNKEGKPAERSTMASLSSQWRRQFGNGAVVTKAVDLYKTKDQPGKGLVIASLRHPGEADAVHQLGGKVVWMDADASVRYQRIYSRGQGSKDNKTFEQFIAEEQAEMQHSGDSATLSIAEVKAKADIFITNNSNNIDEFKQQVQKALELQ